jgi:hypothetical protein
MMKKNILKIVITLKNKMKAILLLKSKKEEVVMKTFTGLLIWEVFWAVSSKINLVRGNHY